jgi:hypothetical protein
LPQQFLRVPYNISLPIATSDLQKYLDAFYKIHEAEEKALAYVAKKNLKQATAKRQSMSMVDLPIMPLLLCNISVKKLKLQLKLQHVKLFLRLSSQIIRNVPEKMIQAAQKPQNE